MGKKKNMARFEVADEEGHFFTLVMFRDLERLESYVDEKFGEGMSGVLFSESGGVNKKIRMDIIYYPSINEFRGKNSIQFILQDFK